VAPPAGRFRPWRNLAIFAGVVAVLYSLVYFTGGGGATPKLGIDLQGGTRVTLTARTVDGRPPARESLDQARQIIEQRVNGIGVSGAEVVLDGTNLIITVPGENGDQARTLGQTARLYFRTVIEEQSAGVPAPVQHPGTSAPAAPPAPQQPPAGSTESTPTP